MVYAISRKGDGHTDYCEDANFVLDLPRTIIFGAFDGCSTGINSYFASALLCRCMKYHIQSTFDIREPGNLTTEAFPAITARSLNALVGGGCRYFKYSATLLGLTDMEQLSTAVVCAYNKIDKTLHVKMLGDGNVWVELDNGSTEHITKHFPGNSPDYLGYHTNKSDHHVQEWVTMQFAESFKDVNAFAIGTDGVESIRPVNGAITRDSAMEYLVFNTELKSSKAMLARKLNILKHSLGCAFDDDITILRYIPD